jgi:hypothetical protein
MSKNNRPRKNIEIEVCIAVYQRYYRLPEIIRMLNEQTVQDFNLNIWNNSGQDLTPFVKDFPEDRLRIFGGVSNGGSAARFKIVPETKGNCIIFFDDDETLDEDFVEYNYQKYKEYKDKGEKCILGWYTRTFVNDRYNPSFDNPPEGHEVDYIGTGGMVLDREIFDKEPELQNIPEPFDQTEDLYLCYLARTKYGMTLRKLKQKCSIEVDGKDQFHGINKEEIYLRLRDMNWVILQDMQLQLNVLENLVLLKEVMDELKIPFWLSEGLLLGLYRDGFPIKGDEDDTDVCVWYDFAPHADQIIEGLQKKGFTLLDAWRENGIVEGMALARGTNKIDIIFTRKKDNEVFFLARNYFSIGSLPYFAFVFPAKPFESFDEIEWGGQRFPVPHGIEEYLVARYGADWKTPKLRNAGYSASSLKDNPCYRGDFKVL